MSIHKKEISTALWLKQRRKVIISGLGTTSLAVQSAISDGHISSSELCLIITGSVTTFLLYIVPNEQMIKTPSDDTEHSVNDKQDGTVST